MRAAEGVARRALVAWLGSRAESARLRVLGAGHINDTWLVVSGQRRLVLQRISEAVFPDPPAIARKVAAVCDHVASRVPVAPLVAAEAGAHWHQDGGGVWRVSRFMGRSRTLQSFASDAQAAAAGAAFGRFQRALVGLPAEVPDPIPGFLQLEHYLAELDDVVRSRIPPGPDAERIINALERINRRRDLMGALGDGDRLIHGDCKLDNLLFHESRNEVRAVIDLDTVMRGHWAWDFGDLVRASLTDEGDFSVPRFAVLARSFVEAAEVSGDAETLVLAPRHLALMLAVRFLTDHLRGDRYFRVARRGDNLERAWGQLRVLEILERAEAAMRSALAGLE